MKTKKGKIIFITGTDTGAGKTIFTLALCLFLKKNRRKCKVIKPVETGCDPVCEDEALYKRFLGEENVRVFYKLKYPAAPLTAGEREGIEIPMESLVRKISEEEDEITLIEGAGGLLVPINGKKTYLDLILLLKTPVIIVAANRLGVINHTLLTSEILAERGVSGLVILNDISIGEPFLLEDNLKKIRQFSKFPVAGRFPHIEELSEGQLIRGIQPLYICLAKFFEESHA